LPAQCTLVDPAQALYAAMAELSAGPVWSMSLAPGFPAADIADCGPSILAYGDDPDAVQAAADDLAGRLAAMELAFTLDLLSPDAAVARAIVFAARAGRPVVLADTQDNPGGGAAGDGVAILDSLVRHDAQGAVLGLLCDARAAAAAHQAGVGARLDIGLGAGSGYGGASPLVGPFVVERLGDGRFTGTGPFYGGNRMQLGPMALLRIGGVRVAVSSVKQQAADQAMFRHLGVEPAEASILALKSSVHFRADFAPLAAAILLVEAPGANAADPATQPFRRLRQGVRLRPGGPAFRRAPR
jgi:microcystin degradation protein MlrC